MMPIAEADIFFLFRQLLVIVCIVYVIVCAGRTLMRWQNYFSSSRHGMLMGRYTKLLLLRLELRRFAGDIVQIAFLVVVLGYLIYQHYPCSTNS